LSRYGVAWVQVSPPQDHASNLALFILQLIPASFSLSRYGVAWVQVPPPQDHASNLAFFILQLIPANFSLSCYEVAWYQVAACQIAQICFWEKRIPI
jgi:hypothetical protein